MGLEPVQVAEVVTVVGLVGLELLHAGGHRDPGEVVPDQERVEAAAPAQLLVLADCPVERWRPEAPIAILTFCSHET